MPSWAVAALCMVSLCLVLTCTVWVWKKWFKKKDKDKDKDKKKGKEKGKGGFDTEMDGGFIEVGYTHQLEHTHAHTATPTQAHTQPFIQTPAHSLSPGRCIVLVMYHCPVTLDP